MKRLSTNCLFLLFCVLYGQLYAQDIPAGYYDSAKNQKGKGLLTALHTIIDNHKNVGYDGLWAVYEKSDVRPDGTVWDIYSTATFYPGKGQCGNYKYVGDCYNREHSFPKSWFSKGSPMKSDAFHIYPTDGKVNGQRSNYPYGETEKGKRLPSNNGAEALGKLGECTFPGCSGTVFEPDDEYKGDLARTYFYMAARYLDKIKSWGGGMVANNDYCYKPWAVNLLLKWHRQDPVSQKEIDRNNAVYEFQHNRNPFIDNPELVEYIWGNSQNDSWTPGGNVKPHIIVPVTNSVVDMGITGINLDLSKDIAVKGQNLQENLTVSIQGDGFSVSTNTLLKTDVLNGTNITVTFHSTVASNATAVLTLHSNEDTSSITLQAKAVNGIPALNAEKVELTSFVARWIHVGGNSNYHLKVWSVDQSNPVLEIPVRAADEMKEITDLEMNTDYHYQLFDGFVASNIIDVKTLTPIPVLSMILPEGGLNFEAIPGNPSPYKEVEVTTEYIYDEITATVTPPFEISSDKEDWKQNLNVAHGESFYIRMSAVSKDGEYVGLLSLNTPSVEGDEVDVKAFVELPVDFVEDFENAKIIDSYPESGTINGTAFRWNSKDAGVCGRPVGDKFNGTRSVCFGKKGNSSIEMQEDIQDGVSALSFVAALYGSDSDAEMDIMYSVDGGNKWTKLASEVISNTVLRQFNYSIDISSPIRFKFQKTSGKRFNIDDIAYSKYAPTSINKNQAEDYAWDAYVRQDKLMLEVNKPGLFNIYTANAATVYSEMLSKGSISISLPSGMYIVVCGDKAKKVVIK